MTVSVCVRLTDCTVRGLSLRLFGDLNSDAEGLGVGEGGSDGDKIASGVTVGADVSVFDMFWLGIGVRDLESVLDFGLSDFVSVADNVLVML